MGYYHCGNGYHKRCDGYKGPLDTYACHCHCHEPKPPQQRFGKAEK